MSNLELGVIGNCQIAVLVDTRGRFVWGSFPRLDSDPAFCSLLAGNDKAAESGFFDIELLNLARTEQRYLDNTAILETILYDEAGGAVKVIDFAPRYQHLGRSFHPIMVMRQVIPLAGSPAVRVRLRPAASYAADVPTVTHGSNHIRYDDGRFVLRLTTNASLAAVLEERAFVLSEPIHLILGADESIPEAPGKLTQVMYEETKNYWEGWSRALSVPFEWQEAVIRAAITLKLCTFEDTGAVVAALTTSLPEAAHSGRNWDYRFCWLRDSFYTVHALNRLGATRTMGEFLRYLFNIVAESGSAENLQPVFGISGQTELTEITVESLPGYRGMGPVRVGNDAYRQVQNDVYGATILAATQYFFDQRLIKRGTEAEFRKLEELGEQAAALYNQPDAGIWEFRGRQHIHTHSSVMCWAACDRLGRIARKLALDDRAEHWEGLARSMREHILEAAWNEELNSFVAAFGGTDLDASLLTMAELGFIEPQDPRFLGTLDAIERVLKRGDYLFRYANADDFGMPETAFNICTFWFIGALAAVGRQEEARDMFTNMLAKRNHLGLLSEDLDPQTGELWGNFPQTYSMVGIIVNAMRLSRSWEEAL